MNLSFFINSMLLGIGLAMDAFSVSLADGLNEPKMRRRKMASIAAVFGGFQFAMTFGGWICVHTVMQYISAFQAFVPWIALALLGYIGGNMLLEGLSHEAPEESASQLTFKTLLIQGVATSIDALSVGFAIAAYSLESALVCAAIIFVETCIISIGGILIGRAFGTRLSGKASILGGLILIGIGLEIFISNIFF